MRIARYVICLAVATLLWGCQTDNYHQEQKAAATARWQTMRTRMSLDLARQQLENGDPAAALTSVRTALGINPEQADAHLLHGRILLAQDKPRQARAALERCLELAPYNAEAWYYQGTIFERWRDFERAEEAFVQAYAADPLPATHILALAHVMVQQGRAEAALAKLAEHGRRIGPETAVIIAEADILVSLRRNEEAVERYRRALQIGGENPAVSESLAYVLMNNGRTAEALAMFQQLAEQGGAGNGYEYERAQCHMRLQQYHQAGRCLEIVVQRHPERAAAWALLAQARLARNDVVRAGEAVATALALEPDDADILVIAAYAAVRNREFVRGEQHLRRALRLAPDHALAHSLLGAALHGQGRPEEATGAYERALELDPQDALAQRGLAAAQRDS